MTMRGPVTILGTLFLWSALAPSALAEPGQRCEGLLPSAVAEGSTSGVTPEHLARLRDIGQAYGGDPSRSLFSLAPNKRSIAFQIHRGDPETNSYCVGLVVLELRRGARPVLVDTSEELIMDSPAWYGWSAFHIGTPAPVTPRWLPNGERIAYLKRTNGLTQAWLANVDGTDARQVTNSATDVDDFRLSGDGRALIYASRPDVPKLELEIDREGLSGWHFDERAFPVRGARPQVPSASSRYLHVDLETGAERAAKDDELQLFNLGNNQRPRVTTPGESAAWSEPENAAVYPPDYRLVATIGARRFVCPSSTCKLDRSSSIAWTGDGQSVIFTRREGWANSLTGIYVWKPNANSLKRSFQTSDALIECQPYANGLICLRERSSEPRHFVYFDLRSDKVEPVFDPNPEYGQLAMGRVERLHWRNKSGIPWYGDLVYPVGYQVGQRYPMVVVQYRTKGFLRGGTGDEVPIQTLADMGFLVLSVDNLTYEDIIGKQRDSAERTAAFNRDFTGRRHILSAIEAAIEMLDRRGLILTNKIGITGLSDGCTTAKFAAINSDMFAAGSVSGCGLEPDQDAILGPMISRTYHESGWPRLAENNTGFWSKIAFTQHPRRVRFPMLFQAAENEYLAMVGSHTALRQVGIPSDLYIFPGENHIKSQPSHRLAVYRRNLAWFQFWLKDGPPTAPISEEESARWKMMRAEWSPALSYEERQTESSESEDQ